jgi:hypothetical protein
MVDASGKDDKDKALDLLSTALLIVCRDIADKNPNLVPEILYNYYIAKAFEYHIEGADPNGRQDN